MESENCEANGKPLISLTDYEIGFTVIIIILNIVTAVIAVILNTIVIVTIWKTPSLQTPSKILLCNLALTDLLVGAVVQLLHVTFYIHALIRSFYIFCLSWRINRRIGYSVGMVTMETLAAISIDRCLAIKTRVGYRNIVTKKRVITFLVFSWVFGFAVVVISIQFAAVNTLLLTTSVNILFLLSIITTSYSISFHAMKKMSSRVNPNQPNQSPAGFNIWKYRRSLITMVIVLAICLLSYLPMVLYNAFSLSSLGNVAMRHIAEFFITLNSSLNPVLYLWRMKDLRAAAKRLVF